MELSRSCLESLSLFQQRFFSTPEEIESFIQEEVNAVCSGTPNCIRYSL